MRSARFSGGESSSAEARTAGSALRSASSRCSGVSPSDQRSRDLPGNVAADPEGAGGAGSWLWPESMRAKRSTARWILMRPFSLLALGCARGR
jgi:hypothetical protein